LKKKLLVMGESYMNFQMKTNPPQKDKNVTYGTECSFHPYGEGAMTAIAAAKVGGDCVFCTKLGADAYGERLKGYYKSCGIHLSSESLTEGTQTGMSMTVYSDAENGHTYVSKGANLCFSKQDVDDAFAHYPDMFVLPQDDILFQLSVPQKVEAKEEPVHKESTIDELISMDDVSVEDDDDFFPTEYEDLYNKPMKETTIKLGSDGEIEDFSETISFANDKPTEEINRMKAAESANLVMYAARLAAQRNTDILVHYNEYTSKLPLHTLDGIKILVVSDKMLQEISGIHQTSTDKTLRALIPLAAKIKAKYYIVQQGNDTSFVYDGNYYETVKLPAELKLRAKQESSQMHGTYIGALAARFLKTRDIIDACKFASVTSILTQSKFGCLDHAPSFMEIANFTAEQK
jgi:sugar/nucleoside kinase (ribokinase family)